MIDVRKAAKIIDSVKLNISVREVEILKATGMVLRQQITTDRDLPPFDRVMMDGIAIRYEQWEKGQSVFPVEGLQKAGSQKLVLGSHRNCLEVMTGAILPENTDTVIRYEDVEIQQKKGQNTAVVQTGAKVKYQNIHPKGTNRKKGDLLVDEGVVLSPAEIGAAATAGESILRVSKPPQVAVVSTGDELVEITRQPLPYQIRRSNAYMLSAALHDLGIEAELFHLDDEKKKIFEKLGSISDLFDVLILSGGVSKGKLDFIPEVLKKLGVNELFHNVRQRPGKPFWFGRSEKTVVFALPGNPVSSFVCYYRYVAPWLKKHLGIKSIQQSAAQLTEDVSFEKKLTCFLQVKVLINNKGIFEARPVKGRGSSDLANLCLGDGFLELPEDCDYFSAGESYPLYLYRRI